MQAGGERYRVEPMYETKQQKAQLRNFVSATRIENYMDRKLPLLLSSKFQASSLFL